VPDNAASRLHEPLAKVLGGKTAKVLADGLDLHTVEDLLRHYPKRYAERGRFTDLAELRPDEHVTVLAEIAAVSRRQMQQRRGSIVEVVVTDGRGRLTLTFFNQPWREKQLRAGHRGLFSGKVSSFRGKVQLTHPDYQLLDDVLDDDMDEGRVEDPAAFTDALIPVYAATTVLPSWRLAKAVRMVLDTLDETVDAADPLPELVRRRHRLPRLRVMLECLHQPRSDHDVAMARRRLRWEEAFLLQTVLAQRRAAIEATPATPRCATPGGLLEAFDARLPFTLTTGQLEVGAQLADELAQRHPMHRLLQGEVGSGKTVVALRAMLTVVDAGGQAALLAPTEVLAQQHHRVLTALLGPLAEGGLLGGAEAGTRVALLTGSQGAAVRRRALLDAASGDAGIVVGTHALLEEDVVFFDLGLVVVDEQHRFGVEQRDTLRAKADKPPHLLVMTATPIPRTVAMTVFGDLEISTLHELPAGRSIVATHVVPVAEKPAFLQRTWERIREEVAAGRQVYVVCSRIGEQPPATGERVAGDAGDELGEAASADHDADVGADAAAQPRRPPLAVLDIAPMLTDGPLAGLRIDMLHGRMSADDKDGAMRRFGAGEIDVLVATTVIEVGVDVPNATVMVVLDAERFGVSQLHQLRGRVGRGDAPGLCLLVTDAPAGTPARGRLDAVAATLDGFELARVDLEQRREGDVLGASQSGGRSGLRWLGVIRDEDIIKAARQEASALVAADPQLRGHPALATAVATLIEGERADHLDYLDKA